MRDFRLASQSTLARAIHTTFERRGTPILEDTPLALTPEFAAVEGKREQWTGFLRKNGLSQAGPDFESVITDVTAFLVPVLEGLRCGSFDSVWAPGGPWA